MLIAGQKVSNAVILYIIIIYVNTLIFMIAYTYTIIDSEVFKWSNYIVTYKDIGIISKGAWKTDNVNFQKINPVSAIT